MSIILTKSQTPVQIDSKILERIRSGQGSSFLYIVSTQRTVKRLTKKFLELAGEVYFEPQIYTLKTLSAELYRRFGSGRKKISDAVQTIMMQGIVNQMELEYLRPDPEISVPQGTIVRLVEMINRLKTAGVSTDILESDLDEASESEAKKLNDILRIYKRYEQELRKNKENKLIDQADIFREVAYLLSKSSNPFKTLFPEVDLVVVSGYDVFSAYNFKIIDSIALIKGIDTYVALDLNLSNQGLFGHLIENYQNFIDSGFQEISRSIEKADRVYFSCNLFSDDELSERIDLTDKISLIKTKTREDEVETIAKLIKNVMAKGQENKGAGEQMSRWAGEHSEIRNLKSRKSAISNQQSAIRIGVAFYQLEIYAPLIREIFPVYGIPFNIDTGYELSNSPVVISILSLMEAVVENFSRRNVLRALKTPYFSFRDEEDVDTGNLYAVSANLKITGSASDWQDKIDDRLKSLKFDLDDRVEAERSSEACFAQDERRSLLRAQRDIEYFIKLLEPIKTSSTPQQFKDNLILIIEALRLPKQILQPIRKPQYVASFLCGDTEVENDIRAYKKFLDLLDSVIDFIQLRHDDGKKHSLAFYLNALKLAISQTTFYTRGNPESGVQIVPITDMITSIIEPKESLFDIVILGGLVDGEFPAVFYPDIFLREKRAKSEQVRLLEDRFLFYQTVTIPSFAVLFTSRSVHNTALPSFRRNTAPRFARNTDLTSETKATETKASETNPEKYLYLTYPGFGNEGIELVRSPFVDEILRIAKVEETTAVEFDKVVYNEEKLLKIYGEHLWHGYKPDGFSLSSELSDKLKTVEHNIKVKKSRTERETSFATPILQLPEYNGIIFDSLKSSSQKQISQLKDRTYSISQLETYGKCPFRYFAHRILRLNQLEEVEEGLSYLERGNLLHEIMYEFYSNRRDGKPIKECDDREFEDAVRELLAIAKSKIDQIQFTGLFWEIKVEHIVGEPGKRKGVLRTFLEDIDQAGKTIAVPEYFEVPFGDTEHTLRGLRARQKTELDLGEIKIGDVKMQGKIDRIEIGDGFFVVADYKTGSAVPKIDDIIEGRSIQLPIYLKALEQFWAHQQELDLKGVAGVYYQLRDKCEAKLGLGSAEYKNIAFKAGSTSGQIVPGRKANLSLDEVVNIAIDHLSRYVEAISHGEFPLTRHEPDKVCRYCPYKRICRISPTGVGRSA